MPCVIVAIALAACTSTPVIEPTDGARDVTIYVVRHDWHTGIVLRRADIPPDVWPEKADFPQATHLEVGWGDREYYPAHDPGSGTASRAAFVGGPGVLHVVGLREDPYRAFPRSESSHCRFRARGCIACAVASRRATSGTPTAGRLLSGVDFMARAGSTTLSSASACSIPAMCGRQECCARPACPSPVH